MRVAEWFLLILAAAAGIAGLFLAAASGAGTTEYILGLSGFVAGIIYAFALLKRVFDRMDRDG